MICKCILGISNSVFPFTLNLNYFYSIEYHKETGMIIYFVKGDKVDNNFINGFPFTEESFIKYFECTQEIRENKLNQILN